MPVKKSEREKRVMAEKPQPEEPWVLPGGKAKRMYPDRFRSSDMLTFSPVSKDTMVPAGERIPTFSFGKAKACLIVDALEEDGVARVVKAIFMVAERSMPNKVKKTLALSASIK